MTLNKRLESVVLILGSLEAVEIKVFCPKRAKEGMNGASWGGATNNLTDNN